MKLFSLILLSILLNSSCKSLKHGNVKCNTKAINILKSLSIPLIQNKNTKVYSLDYTKLPELSKDRYLEIGDSINNIYIFPCEKNCAKHYSYINEILKLSKLNCSIYLNDIQKYFGKESLTATKENKITALFYFFNNQSNNDCFMDVKSLSSFDKCSTIGFKFDSNSVLSEIIVDSFSYF